MSVVGFDIGNFKSTVGVARAGGIEIVANEYSDRITPTYVAFTNNERFQGHSAKQQEITNSRNTISMFKRLIGRKFDDSQVQVEKSYQPMRVSPASDGKINFEVDYLNEAKQLTSEQIMGMFMTKLKTIAEMNLNSKVVDCVVSVPSFMTDAERRAIIDSAQVAGLNTLKLMNETTALALAYGLYHTSLPEVNEKPMNVVFVDMGYTQIQASVVAFNKGKLRMLATTFDNNLGGRDLDRVLCDYFQKDFLARYKIDAYSNTRARLRLRAECEKLKKLMSSNSAAIPLNIECFMNDIDVSGKMKREDFEKLSESIFVRVKKVLTELLQDAKISPKDIDSVEIVGGSTRIPSVKQLIKDIYGKEPSTTLNADEACARGCTIMCAILSPTFKVKEFKIEECQLFPITLSWKGAETDDNELEVFPRFEKIPLSKLLTIYKKEPFEIEARYRYPNNIPYSEARIGKFYVNDVRPNAQGDNSEVKLKARITKNGIFEISNPQLIESVEVAVKPEEQTQQQTAEAKPESGENLTANEGENTNPAEPEAPMSEEASSQGEQQVKKKKTRAVDLTLTAKVPQLSKTEINNLFEQEMAMIQQDKKEKERSEAKNAVEEYIYEMRDKLSNDYERFILEDHKNAFLKLLDEAESWLYSDEAENQEKSVYVERLQRLKNYGEPLRKRHKESMERPGEFEALGRSIQLIKKAVNQYLQNDEKYSHIEKSEMEKVAKYLEEKERWFHEKSNLINAMKPYDEPAVLASQIKAEKESLDKSCWAILNKPKPKAEPPKPKETTEQPQPQQPQQSTGNEQTKKPDEMDVD